MDPELLLLQMALAQGGLRLDSNQTALVDRALKHVEAQTYDIEYPELTHRQDIPTDNSVPAGATGILYQVFDVVGEAAPIANHADDPPSVDVVVAEETIPVKAFGDKYEYSLDDMQRAGMSGVGLPERRAQAARDVLEEKLDHVAYFGYPSLRIRGFTNNEMVPVLSAGDNQAETSTSWSDKTSQEIVRDLNAVKNHIPVETKQIYRCTAMRLATSLYQHIESTPYGVDSDRTILQWFRANNPDIDIQSRPRLEEADADGTGPRIVGYFNSPQVLQHKIPMEFSTVPPQAKAFAFLVHNWVKTSGTHIYRPKAVVYMDGAGLTD